MGKVQFEKKPKPYLREWKDMSGEDFAQVDHANTVVCVTLSPMEVHGPHLPVVTDVWEAECLMERTIELLHEAHPKLQFLRLPSLFVASDVVPQSGSVQFRPSTIIRVVEDLGRSLAKQGFRDIWVTSFHGGPRHFVPIEVACDRVNRKYNTRMLSVFSMLIGRLTKGSSDLSDVFSEIEGVSREDLAGDAHGGAGETSMMLYLLGEKVKGGYEDLPQRTVERVLEEAGKAPLQKGAKPTLWELLRGFRYKIRYFEEDSYAGKPSVSSAELGQQMFDILSKHSQLALDEVLNGTTPMSACHSPLWPVRWAFTVPLIGWVFERVVGFRSAVW